MRFTLADFTANREFHPAPKTLLFSCSYQEYLLYRTSAIALEDFGNISEVYMCSEDNGIGVAAYQILVCVTLWHMNIACRVVRPVSLQKIDAAPYAKRAAEANNDGL